MIKELQDIAWNCLPKEFKEEVKAMYNRPFLNDLDFGYKSALLNLFGHNLTSDAEGEELLTVSAITVREMYAANERIKTDASDNELGRTSDHINHVLRSLFGSKCLPDVEPKAAEPKHHPGQKVRYNGYVYEVAGLVGKNRYALKDSFSKERRLNIAARMMQGLICAPIIPGVDPSPPAEYLAQTAFRLADALIAEWRKD